MAFMWESDFAGSAGLEDGCGGAGEGAGAELPQPAKNREITEEPLVRADKLNPLILRLAAAPPSLLVLTRYQIPCSYNFAPCQ